MRRHWLSLLTVWPSHSQISSLSTANLALCKARSRREPNLGCGGMTDLGDVMLCPKSLHESCRMGRRIVMMLICSLGHCECVGHTVHKLNQRCLTADWPAPREGDCSQKHSKVSSDWLPSYVMATWPVLEIFKMAGYFLDSPHKTPLKKITYDSCHNKDIISIHPHTMHLYVTWNYMASNGRTPKMCTTHYHFY